MKTTTKLILALILSTMGLKQMQAQCSASATYTYLGNGEISVTATSSFPAGWDATLNLSGSMIPSNNPIIDITNYSGTFNYTSNGTYIFETSLVSWDPADTNITCVTPVDYDTIVIADIDTTVYCAVNAGSIGHSQMGTNAAYNYYLASFVDGTGTITNAEWIIRDSTGNVIHTDTTELHSANGFPGSNYYMYYTFPYRGYFDVSFYVDSYQPSSGTYCSDTEHVTMFIDTFNVGPCNVYASVSAFPTGPYTAAIFGQASGNYDWGQFYIDNTIVPGDSINYTFTTAGIHTICYYATGGSPATSCEDSACIIYNVSGGISCNASFQMFQDSTNAAIWYATNNSVGSGPISYTWYFGDGDSSTLAYPTHNYAVPGNYIICLVISDANGCSSSTCDSSAAFRMTQQMATQAIIGSFTVLAPAVGISENQSVLAETKVYPNPMAETTRVTYNSSLDANGKIEVVNLLGAAVLSENVSVTKGTNEFKLDTSSLSSGVYYVNIVAEGRVLNTLKAVK